MHVWAALFGAFAQGVAWAIIILAYENSRSAASARGLSVPDFVTAIVWTEFALFALFAVVHVTRIVVVYSTLHGANHFLPPSEIWSDVLYGVLSLLSKAVLTILLLVYAFTADSMQRAFVDSQ